MVSITKNRERTKQRYTFLRGDKEKKEPKTT